MADQEYDEEAAIQAALKLSMLTAQEDDKRRQLKYGVSTRTVLPDQTDRALKAHSTGGLEARSTAVKTTERSSVPPRPAPPTCIARPRPAGNNRAPSVEKQMSVPMSGYVSTPTSATASPLDSPDFLSKLPPPLPTVGPNARTRQTGLGAKTPPSTSQPKLLTTAIPRSQPGQDRPLIALSPPLRPTPDSLLNFDISALDPFKSGTKSNTQSVSQEAQNSRSNPVYGAGNRNLSSAATCQSQAGVGGANAIYATVDKPSKPSVPAVTPGSTPIYGALDRPPSSNPNYTAVDRKTSQGVSSGSMTANAIYGTVDLKTPQGLPAAGTSATSATYGAVDRNTSQAGATSTANYGMGGSGQRASTPVLGYPYGSYPMGGQSTTCGANYMYGSSNLACNTVALPSMVGPGAMYNSNNPPAATQQRSAPALSRPGNRTPGSSGGVLALAGSSAYSSGMSVALPPSSAAISSNSAALTVALPSTNMSSAGTSSGMTVALPPASSSQTLDATQPLVPTRSEPANKPSSLSVNSTGRSRSPVSPFFSQVTGVAMPSPGLEAGDLMDFSHDFEPAEECLSLASFDPLFNVEETRQGATGFAKPKPVDDSQALVPYDPEETRKPRSESDASFELLDPFSVSDLTINLEKKRKKHALEKSEREKMLRHKSKDTKAVEAPPAVPTSRPSAQKLARRNSYICKGQVRTTVKSTI